MWAATVTGARPVDDALAMLDLTDRARTPGCARSPAASGAGSTSRAP